MFDFSSNLLCKKTYNFPRAMVPGMNTSRRSWAVTESLFHYVKSDVCLTQSNKHENMVNWW